MPKNITFTGYYLSHPNIHISFRLLQAIFPSLDIYYFYSLVYGKPPIAQKRTVWTHTHAGPHTRYTISCHTRRDTIDDSSLSTSMGVIPPPFHSCPFLVDRPNLILLNDSSSMPPSSSSTNSSAVIVSISIPDSNRLHAQSI